MPRIVRCEIHPAIGVARVGDGRGYFFGPEVPGAYPEPNSGFKDGQGRVKRQVARFRIYGFDSKGNVVREVTSDEAEITWTVHVANKKAAWYQFDRALDLKDEKASSRRNSSYRGDRSALEIDPGPKIVKGPSASAALEGGNFLGTPVPLGRIETDRGGRLLVLGGKGKSLSPVNAPITSLNNDGWCDDISDGPVTAEVRIGRRKLEVAPAWVVVAPPNYAPGITSPVTMWDVIHDVAVRKGWVAPPVKISFVTDVLPLFERICQLQWVNVGIDLIHGWGSDAHFMYPPTLKRLADNSSGSLTERRKVFKQFRPPGYRGKDGSLLPQMYGDGVAWPLTASHPRKWLNVTTFQYGVLKRWRDGDFVSDLGDDHERSHRVGSLDDLPPNERPTALTRAALEACLGGAFHPGCEMTWPVRHASMYSGAYRFKHRPLDEPEPDYGNKLSRRKALSAAGPLHGSGPGDLTRWMVVPWQVDTANCGCGYQPDIGPYLPTFWPARVPNHVLTRSAYDTAMNSELPIGQRFKYFNNRVDWLRDLPMMDGSMKRAEQFITEWSKVGIICSRESTSGDSDFPPVLHVEEDVSF
jgi:L-Lysine epsilon oxidase N-terminal/L-lysine epsilon oxidase C-terminal domain